MHKSLFDKLRIAIYILQFYFFLARGKFSSEQHKDIEAVIGASIDRLNLMKNPGAWDGKYDEVVTLIFSAEELIKQSKSKLNYKQICEDEVIVEFMVQNQDSFFKRGIQLSDLRQILEVGIFFRRGYMLHDVFYGYTGPSLFSFQVDCLDYLNSAAHFYNEGYDYFYDKKVIKDYTQINPSDIGLYEMKRIQPREEVCFRNFREAYINLILFIESFINSVGYDAFLGGIGKTDIDSLHLRGIQRLGKKNGWKTYSNLGQRIKNISRIIGGNEVDLTQAPYKNYLEDSVVLRNQYVHSSFEIPKTYFTLEDWKHLCDEMIDSKSYELLNAFWKACYPKRNFPKIIFNEFYGSSFKGHQGRFVAND